MFTKLVCSFSYAGFGITINHLPEGQQQKVEVIGVMAPVDPGFVVIVFENSEQKQVPTLVLEDCPPIDFGAMLTAKQLAIRESLGALISNGTGEPQHLIPLKECPLMKYQPDEDESEMLRVERDFRN